MTNEERSEKAMQLFAEGYNCAQSVVGAWADYYGLDFDTALRISSSFGGGIGRMRLTCGAASGMFMLAGLATGTTDPKDREAKARNYQVVQQLAEAFRKEMGSITCGELLGLNREQRTENREQRTENREQRTESREQITENREQRVTNPMPEERTPEYYRKRPCKEIVGCASRIFGELVCGL